MGKQDFINGLIKNEMDKHEYVYTQLAKDELIYGFSVKKHDEDGYPVRIDPLTVMTDEHKNNIVKPEPMSANCYNFLDAIRKEAKNDSK